MPLNLSYIESVSTSSQYNLAMEEYLLLHCLYNECILYLWQNEHTVVIGKNQNAWKECNISKLEEEHGTLTRRLSGGGCVYHDLGNLNFTFITHKDHYDVNKQSEVILKAIQKLGIQAQKSGRNDLLIEGRKFSGHAYYKQKEYCYHHGTIMVDVNKNALSSYLNVSKEKLKAKGVDSVRSRVCNLKEYNKNITIESLKKTLVEAFEEVYQNKSTIKTLCEEEQNEIYKLKEKYASWQWTKGVNMPFSNQFSKRFLWGEIILQIEVKNGMIENLEVYSDAMDSEIAQSIKISLLKCRYDKKDILIQIQGASIEEIYKKDICVFIETLEL